MQSKRVLEECSSTFAVITYDLAIVNIGKKAQNEEPNEFKDIFIMLSAFRIEGSMFSAIGKLIEGSGSPYLLAETGVLCQSLCMDFSMEKYITVVDEVTNCYQLLYMSYTSNLFQMTHTRTHVSLTIMELSD